MSGQVAQLHRVTWESRYAGPGAPNVLVGFAAWGDGPPTLVIDGQTWDALGQPDKVTVTIESAEKENG